MAELPQRVLLFRLKAAVDVANIRESQANPTSVYRRVRALLVENPHGSWSTYVQYNLGKRRREWLRARFGPQPSSPPPATSLQTTRSAAENFSADDSTSPHISQEHSS